MKVRIVPFREADIEEASELLARRHQRDRAHESALPQRFIQPLDTRSAIEKVWKASTVNGFSIDRTSARCDPVELPKASVDRPAFRNSGKRCTSPIVIDAASTVTRSTPASTPLVLVKVTSLPLL